MPTVENHDRSAPFASAPLGLCPPAALLALALCGLLAGAATLHSSWNLMAFTWLNAGGPAWAYAASVLSVLGLGAAMLVVAGAFGLRRPRLLAALLLVVVLGGLAVQVIKSLVGSPRPAAVLGSEAVFLAGNALMTRAMPSGHAALWAAVAGLAWLTPVAARQRRRQQWLAWGLSTLAVIGSLARVALGVHWPADLLAGAGLGLLVAVLVGGTRTGHAAVHKLALALHGKAGSRLVAAGLVALAASLWVAERDYPLAEPVYMGMALGGLAVAWGWWQMHQRPYPWTRPPAHHAGQNAQQRP